jgi:hypothetical protein
MFNFVLFVFCLWVCAAIRKHSVNAYRPNPVTRCNEILRNEFGLDIDATPEDGVEHVQPSLLLARFPTGAGAQTHGNILERIFSRLFLYGAELGHFTFESVGNLSLN